MSRDRVYFVAPRRDGSWRVVPVVEHGPYHERRPASWRGPFASKGDAWRAAINPAIKSWRDLPVRG